MWKLDERYRGCLEHLRFQEADSRGHRPRKPGGKRRPAGKYGFIDDALWAANCDSLFRKHGTTQVFIGRENAASNDRLLHTLEVAALAKFIAIFIRVNEYLTEAIGLGHDTGHAPFGHFGEETISRLCGLIIDHRNIACLNLQHIEREGKGLDLCYETLLGIYHHSGTSQEEYDRLPQEFRLINIVDKIYMFSDIEDGLRIGAGFQEANRRAMYFGKTKERRFESFANALIRESAEAGRISFSTSEAAERFWELRTWMYENCYEPLNLNRQPFASELERCLDFISNSRHFEGCDPVLLLLQMNDYEVHRLFGAIRNQPKPKLTRSGLEHLNLSITRIAPYIRGRSFDLTSPDLDWGKT